MKELRIAIALLVCFVGGIIIYYSRNQTKSTGLTLSFASKSDIEDGISDNLLVKSKDLHNVISDLRVQLRNAQASPPIRHIKPFENMSSVTIPFSEHNITMPTAVVRDSTGLKISHDDMIDSNNNVTITFPEATTGTIYII